MRLIKGKLILSIGIHNARQEDNFELYVDDDSTDAYIEDAINDLWQDFIWNYIDGGGFIESDEKIKNENKINK